MVRDRTWILWSVLGHTYGPFSDKNIMVHTRTSLLWSIFGHKYYGRSMLGFYLWSVWEFFMVQVRTELWFGLGHEFYGPCLGMSIMVCDMTWLLWSDRTWIISYILDMNIIICFRAWILWSLSGHECYFMVRIRTWKLSYGLF